MIKVLSVDELATADLTEHDVLVVCDPDPIRTAEAARNLPCRSAVYAGHVSDAAATELAKELEAGQRP